MKISVIIPVYNGEMYLKRCLDSIQNQTCKDFEVILIDDGSTDASGKICDQYAKQNSYFKVYHQENKGVTRTREIGISRASGEYVIWVDADDWVNETLIEKVIQVIEEKHPDIVVYGDQYFSGDEVAETELWKDQPIEQWRKDAVMAVMTVLWNFAVKRSFWMGESAPKEMSRSAADGYMAIRLFMKAGTVNVIPEILYYHLLDSPYSISRTITGRKYLGNYFLWKYRMEIAKEKFPQYVPHCAQRALSNGVKAFCMSLVYNDLDDDERNTVMETLQKLMGMKISGRYRDKLLCWAILNRHWGLCKFYARHKKEKTEKKNKIMLTQHTNHQNGK